MKPAGFAGYPINYSAEKLLICCHFHKYPAKTSHQTRRVVKILIFSEKTGKKGLFFAVFYSIIYDGKIFMGCVEHFRPIQIQTDWRIIQVARKTLAEMEQALADSKARQRLDSLFDEDSFVEIDRFVSSKGETAAVITG